MLRRASGGREDDPAPQSRRLSRQPSRQVSEGVIWGEFFHVDSRKVSSGL